jgi:hypothetical protein
MTRRADWELEIDDSMKREVWTATGPNRPVKVCPAQNPLDFRLGGYITLGRYLIGKTSSEIERDLGLPRDFLLHGARIYKFSRLPQLSEYEYELTAAHPGGLSYHGPIGKIVYPPGSEKIHQWRIVSGKTIPVEPDYCTVRLDQRLSESWLSKR